MRTIKMCKFDKYRENHKKNNDIEFLTKEIIMDFDQKTYPIKIVEILKKANFKVLMADMSDERISGQIGVSEKFVDKFGTDRIVIINSKESVGHQRFAMAHELAHYIFDTDGKSEYANQYYINELNEYEPEEVRANNFAASLLMPREVFKNKYEDYIRNLKLSVEEAIRLLSEDFGVSKTAVQRRIQEVNLVAEEK